jgi:hypothetical protein
MGVGPRATELRPVASEQGGHDGDLEQHGETFGGTRFNGGRTWSSLSNRTGENVLWEITVGT